MNKNELILCACDCGSTFLKYDKKGRIRKFKHGHRKNDSLWIRFINKIEIDQINGCWIWIGARQRFGYGTIGLGKQYLKAHRLSYEKFVGPIPKSLESKHGMCVCHRCDNPSCVNPDHLFIGTQKNNMQDMHYKNRNGNLKLTINQKKAIKKLLKEGENTAILAKNYNVNRCTINRIRNNSIYD